MGVLVKQVKWIGTKPLRPFCFWLLSSLLTWSSVPLGYFLLILPALPGICPKTLSFLILIKRTSLVAYSLQALLQFSPVRFLESRENLEKGSYISSQVVPTRWPSMGKVALSVGTWKYRAFSCCLLPFAADSYFKVLFLILPPLPGLPSSHVLKPAQTQTCSSGHKHVPVSLSKQSLNTCHFQKKELWPFVYRTCAQYRHFINHILVSLCFSNLQLIKKSLLCALGNFLPSWASVPSSMKRDWIKWSINSPSWVIL